MKSLCSAAFLLLMSFAPAAAQSDAAAPLDDLHVMSFNLRYNEPKDGPNAWPNRKAMVAGVFAEHRLDIAGMQEVLAGMVNDLQTLLPDYGWIGVGRDDGKAAGEFAPIFYNKQRLQLVSNGVFWLSENPEVPGKGWDAAHVRLATWGIFKNKATQKSFFFLNTHMDNKGEQARQNGAKLIIQRIVALHKDLPVIMTGDLNSKPASPSVVTLISDPAFKLTDAQQVSVTPHVGGTQSSNEFEVPGPAKIIDYIFVGPGIKVQTHGYYPTIHDGIFISDHWPVISSLIL